MAGLRACGHKVEVLDPAKSDTYDVVVFSKAYSAENRSFARALKRRGGRVVFDICDNHFYNPFDLPKYQRAREEIGEMISIADRVVCSTPALAKVIRDEVDGAFEPNVIDDIVERFASTSRPEASDQPLRLIWFGSHGSPNAPSGMTDLLLIREELEALAARRSIELTVCSNNQAKYDRSIAPMRVPSRYVEWTLEGFPKLLADSDAVLLPMSINPFTACKTHNRLSTALYAGVPVIASGIDSYREFDRYCTLDDWAGGLQAIVEAGAEERRRALRSRRHIDRRWTMQALAAQWEAALSLPSRAARPADRSLRVHGRLDAVAHTTVTGWVRAPLDPEARLQVVLECDGEPVAVAVASRPREDLRRVGLPADCGFSLPLPPRLVNAAMARLTVRVLESGWVVGENPILVGDDGRPSFSPPPGAPGNPTSRSDQRWEIADDVAAQERAMAELEQARRTWSDDGAAALKAAFSAEEGRPPGRPPQGQGAAEFQNLLRGAIAAP